MSGTVINFINDFRPLNYRHVRPVGFLTQVSTQNTSPDPSLYSLRGFSPTNITAVPKCTPKRGYKITRSQKSKATLSFQPKLKAFRVHSPHKHNQKLNTGNLEAHSLTKYRYIVQRNFLTCNSHEQLYLFLHQTYIYIIRLRSRSIGYNTLPPGKDGTHFTGGWVGRRAGLDGQKISSPPVFDPGPSRP